MKRRLLAFAALGALAVGASLNAAGRHSAGSAVWAVATAGILLPLALNVVRSLLRRDVGVDAIALVAIASALALDEYLAGAVVALMLAGGNALEEYASGRARRELTRLLERMPRIAQTARREARGDPRRRAVRRRHRRRACRRGRAGRRRGGLARRSDRRVGADR